MRDDSNRRGFDSHWQQLPPVILVGVVVGALSWILNKLVQQFIILPLFCHSTDSFTVCANGGSIAWTIAIIVIAALSVVVMVRLYVFRPLLVVLSVLLAVWGIGDWLAGLSYFSATMWQIIIFGIAYSIFAWIARLDKFWLAALVSVLLIIITRIVTASA